MSFLGDQAFVALERLHDDNLEVVLVAKRAKLFAIFDQILFEGANTIGGVSFAGQLDAFVEELDAIEACIGTGLDLVFHVVTTSGATETHGSGGHLQAFKDLLFCGVGRHCCDCDVIRYFPGRGGRRGNVRCIAAV